ncbi:ricin B lectin:Parallel beta-helix [Annulohypoxylon bovei var. microspora]|nr:ricin B lectin:Parallel beta-helix [Annulohypoxylon bovei var. microspora]
MARLSVLTTVLALTSTIHAAACGEGTPDATVTGSGSSFKATKGSSSVYSGSDYRAAIQAALDSISSGQRVAVMASGSIGANTITISSGKTFEGCGTIDTGNLAGKGAIESLNTADVKIPYLTMTGNPYFGLHFYGTKNLALGQITMNLSGGLGIRFDRDAAANSNVTMDTITVTGAGSHAVETWNIDGLEIKQVIAKDVGECGLLLQETTNAHVGLVDGDNVAAGTGYATFRMANNNGQNANGNYNTNVYVDKVVSRGGGRGIFCVSQSGAAVITEVDLASNGNNAILIENCYNVSIRGGKVNGGGEVRLSARDEFPNNKDIWITLTVDGTTVRESPCGDNTNWTIQGGASMSICA